MLNGRKTFTNVQIFENFFDIFSNSWDFGIKAMFAKLPKKDMPQVLERTKKNKTVERFEKKTLNLENELMVTLKMASYH